MNDLQVFGFEGRNVRVVEKDGSPWWVLADVCEILELSNPSMVASRLDDDEKNTLSLAEGIITDGTGNPNATVINESGLYTVILRRLIRSCPSPILQVGARNWKKTPDASSVWV